MQNCVVCGMWHAPGEYTGGQQPPRKNMEKFLLCSVWVAAAGSQFKIYTQWYTIHQLCTIRLAQNPWKNILQNYLSIEARHFWHPIPLARAFGTSTGEPLELSRTPKLFPVYALGTHGYRWISHAVYYYKRMSTTLIGNIQQNYVKVVYRVKVAFTAIQYR